MLQLMGHIKPVDFRQQPMAILEIAEDGLGSLALPVTWDPAHILNLTVVNVKDLETQAGRSWLTAKVLHFYSLWINLHEDPFLLLANDLEAPPTTNG